MSEQAKRSRKLKRHWKQELAKWRESNLSGQAWCEEEKQSYCQFSYWKRALCIEKDPPTKPNLSNSFVEISDENSKKAPGIRIEAENITVQLDQDFDMLALKKVLRALQESFSC